jgi:hypothetical protein
MRRQQCNAEFWVPTEFAEYNNVKSCLKCILITFEDSVPTASITKASD